VTTRGSTRSPARLVVLVSGAGTNLQALLDACSDPSFGAQVVAVGADRTGTEGLARAERAGVPTFVRRVSDAPDRATWDREMTELVAAHDPDLVVSAGFLKLAGPAFLERFGGRYVNTHPALLPAFPGIGSVEQAVAYGVKVAGVTVHFVDEGVDTGPIIAQRAIDVPEGADAAALRLALRPLEHELLPAVVGKLARGEVTVDPGNPRHVLVA